MVGNVGEWVGNGGMLRMKGKMVENAGNCGMWVGIEGNGLNGWD